jgi:hypothetical protein
VIAIVTVLFALPLGFFVRNRVAGFLAYGLLMAHVYTFQTATLLIEWAEGSDAAFPREGSTTFADTWGYLAVTSFVYVVGLGLVALGQRLRSRRDGRRDVVSLQPA